MSMPGKGVRGNAGVKGQARSLALIELPKWADDALCAGLVGGGGVDLWFDPPGKSWEPARKVCAVCPVRLLCKLRALDMLDRNVPVMGMMGGLTPRELVVEGKARGMILPPHGSRQRYKRHECRCEECRAANAAYQDSVRRDAAA